MLVEFKFQSLPLMRIGDGFEAGTVDGGAMIDFPWDAPGSWRVARLYVTASRARGANPPSQAPLTPMPGLAALIEHTLLTHPVWNERVRNTIAANIDRDHKQKQREAGARFNGMVDRQLLQ